MLFRSPAPHGRTGLFADEEVEELEELGDLEDADGADGPDDIDEVEAGMVGGFDPAELLPDDDEPDAGGDPVPVAEDAALRVRLAADLEAEAEAEGGPLLPGVTDDGTTEDRTTGFTAEPADPDVAAVLERQLYPAARPGDDEEPAGPA